MAALEVSAVASAAAASVDEPNNLSGARTTGAQARLRAEPMFRGGDTGSNPVEDANNLADYKIMGESN